MRILLFLFLATLTGQCQTATSSLRFLAFPRIQDDTPVELLLGERSMVVDLPSSRLSDPIEVPSQGKWSFGKTGQNEQGEPAPQVWGTGAAAKSKKQIVILLRKGPKNSDGFKVLSYEDGRGKFDEKQMLFLNLTSQPIAGDIGTIKFGLKPGQHKIVTPKGNIREGLCHASLLLEKNDKWHPFFSTNWPIKPTIRGIVLLYNDPSGRKVRLHTISDAL